MQSILKRVLSGASVVAALGAAASIQASGAQAYSNTCFFVPFVTNICSVNAPATGFQAGYAAYNDGLLGSDFLGAVDTYSDLPGNVSCKARVTYANASFKQTSSTTALNTSAYVAGSTNGWFVEGAGNQFPTTVRISCP